jgi:hypothetical protein
MRGCVRSEITRQNGCEVYATWSVVEQPERGCMRPRTLCADFSAGVIPRRPVPLTRQLSGEEGRCRPAVGDHSEHDGPGRVSHLGLANSGRLASTRTRILVQRAPGPELSLCSGLEPSPADQLERQSEACSRECPFPILCRRSFHVEAGQAARANSICSSSSPMLVPLHILNRLHTLPSPGTSTVSPRCPYDPLDHPHRTPRIASIRGIQHVVMR